MAIFKRGRVYWFHFTFNGQHIQESTKHGNRQVARQMEADRRSQLAREKQDRENAAQRLGHDPSTLIRCAECEKFFSSEVQISNGNHRFCGTHCHLEFTKKRTTVPELGEFCRERVAPWARSLFAHPSPNTWRWYRAGLQAIYAYSPIAITRIDQITGE